MAAGRILFGVTGGGIRGGKGPGEFAQIIESLGYDAVWVGEHFNNWGPMLDCVPTMAYMAARTSRIKVGSAIMLFPLRHPTVVAKSLSTLDVLSSGRMILGVGIGGENPKEFESTGVPVKERGPRASEGLVVLRRLLSEDHVTHQGRFFQFADITMEPKPVQKPLPPILVAGRREGAMRRAALYGDGWFPYLYSPDQYAKSVARVKEFAQEAGRSLDGFQFAVYQFTSIASTKEEARRNAAASLQAAYKQNFEEIAARYCVLGTPQECVARLREYVDAGARHIVFANACPPDQAEKQIRRLREEVVPAFTGG
jgi:probable F420-dependent oxidoreductase